MQIIIRELDKKDYPDIVLLRNNELGGNITLEELSAKMDIMNKNEYYKTFVALYENNVVGFISTIIVLAVEFPIGYLRIDGLAVNKNIQSKGIGTKLLVYAENYAKEKGITASSLNSNFKRTDAHTFYEYNGYTKHAYYFVKGI